MIDIEFLSYEDSLTFKALGFTEACIGFWIPQKQCIGIDCPRHGSLIADESCEWKEIGKELRIEGNLTPDIIGVKSGKYVQAPIRQQALNWLRKKYRLHAVIIPTLQGAYTFKIVDVQDDPENPIERPPYKGVHAYDYATPEEAELAAIREMLSMIKK